MRERAAAMLREHGLRATGPRVELLAALLAGDGSFLSAEALIERAGSADPPVHRATVYRTLDGLTRVGVVRHVHLSVGPVAYAASERPEPAADHELFVECRRCARLVPLPLSVLGDTAARVRRLTGFRLEPGHVALSGLCPECLPSEPARR